MEDVLIEGRPSIIALAGPNGAGKSTVGPALIRKTLGVSRFVDADLIARGLSPADPAHATLAAGKAMLKQLRDLAAQRLSFAYETTLASRTYAPWIRYLLNDGWTFHLLFIWLPGADFAIQRVRGRVRLGGHDVPDAVVRRRYAAGLSNFFGLYQPLAETWHVYDNSDIRERLLAAGRGRKVTEVPQQAAWDEIVREFGGV